jgi:formate hydrogenlyase subunit 4
MGSGRGKMKTVIMNLLIIFLIPFIFGGIIIRVKALWAGRKGAPLLQLFFDFVKYLKKGEVVSTATGFIFYAAPVISLVSVILTPFVSGAAILGFDGDFILFAYLMALSKFVSLAAAMDTGSSFEGMGASREASFTALTEPAFFIILGTGAAVYGEGSFAALRSFTAHGTSAGWLMAALAASGFMIMLVTEGARLPVDDPNTHLELTMIHEAMILDNSGPDMALITYTANLKMLLICSLAANALMPAGLEPGLALAALLGFFAAAAFLIGCVESLMARLRMTHVPQFVFFMSSLALILFAAAFIFIQGGAR